MILYLQIKKNSFLKKLSQLPMEEYFKTLFPAQKLFENVEGSIMLPLNALFYQIHHWQRRQSHNTL